VIGTLFAAFLSFGANRAMADDDAPPVDTTAEKPSTDDKGEPLTPAEQEAIKAPVVVPVAEPGSHDPTEKKISLYFALSGAVDKAAVAGAVGGRMRLTSHWTIGLDGEWNPWISLSTTKIRGGAINVYMTGIGRLPLAYEKFNLRSTVNLGASYLLTPLYGAPSGSIGLYVGVSPLGVEWKASESFYLIVNPINISIPIPQLRGVPLLYPQYRFTVGMEF
jgi:hypothetical protein